MTSQRVAAFFCMKPLGHVHRSLPLIGRLVRSGVKVVAFGDARYRRDLAAAGAEFFDLFGRFPIDGLDDESKPHSVRYVTYAARYGEEIAKELERLGVSLVLYDTFALIGRAAAHVRRLPYVNLCAGHAPDPVGIEQDLRQGGFVNISAQCIEAVRRLRGRYGIGDAHPFVYISHRSPILNVYCEPPQFLEPPSRPVPAEFFGSIPDDWQTRGASEEPCFATDDETKLKVCVSFGTMIRKFYPEEALRALQVISETIGRLPWVQAIISLGGTGPSAAVESGGRNVSVQGWIDPWRVLREADVLITHHGLNSTHEAVVNRVPMLSYPFLWDQPGLAKKCQNLGLALPLTKSPREPLTPRVIRRALETLAAGKPLARNLDRARGWELEVMARRGAVVRRILGLGAPS